jgi:hypothetical protein
VAQKEDDSVKVTLDPGQPVSRTNLTLADQEQYISNGNGAAAGTVRARSSRADEARDRAADARDRAAEARERHAAESGGVDEAMLALRALRVAGAYARQEAAQLRGTAEVDRELAADFWRDAAIQHRDKR